VPLKDETLTPLILVYDFGTTSLKRVVFDEKGDETASISIPYTTSYPAAGPGRTGCGGVLMCCRAGNKGAFRRQIGFTEGGLFP